MHEAPILDASAPAAEPGHVLAVETPYYVHALGGFAAEDVVIVTANEVERLTHAPVDLVVAG